MIAMYEGDEMSQKGHPCVADNNLPWLKIVLRHLSKVSQRKGGQHLTRFVDLR